MSTSPPISLEFLGSGTSTGVPCIGCDCAVCKSTDPRNKRLRPSVLVRRGETALVVDTGPDFREQMLRSKVTHIDALLITHYHADHVVGIDDVRRFNMLQKKVIDCWADAQTALRIKHSFGYVFTDTLRPGLPNLTHKEIKLGEPFVIGKLRIEAFPTDHQVIPNIALKFTAAESAPEKTKTLAYVLDCKRIPDATVEALKGVDTLVLDMLRDAVHPTHVNFEEAIAYVKQIAPRRVFFSHMAHEVDHATFEAKLPEHIRLAYDGLIIDVPQ